MSAYTRFWGLQGFESQRSRRVLYYGIAVLLGGLIGAVALFVPIIYVVLGVGGLIFAYLLFFHVELAVIVALLVLEQLRDYNYLGNGSPFHPNGFMGLSLIFGAAWFFAFHKIDFSRLVSIKPFLGFLIVSFISLLFSGDHAFEGATIVLRLASGFAIYAILVYKTDSIRKVIWVVGVIVAALLWPTINGLVMIARGQGNQFLQLGTARLGGGTSGPGAYLGMILSLCIVFLFEAKTGLKRLLWACLSVVFLLGLFFSYGRAGWIGFVAGLLLLATIKYKRLWFVLPGILLLAVLILPQLSERFADISLAQLGNRQSSTLAVRYELWTAGLAVFRTHNPLFGVGYGVERYRIGEYLAQYAYMAHNDYVAVLVGTGIIGLISFLLWHGQWLRAVWKVYRESSLDIDKVLALGTLTTLFVSLVVRLTDNVVQSTGRLYPLVALVAVTLALPRIRAEEAERNSAPAPQEERPAPSTSLPGTS